MPISVIHELLTQESQSPQPVNQESYAELDQLAVPEFSKLYNPAPSDSQPAISTVVRE